MSVPFTVELDPNEHRLRLSCGQCGDTKDLEFEIVDGNVRITFHDAIDLAHDKDDGAECFVTPVQITV